MDEGNKKEEESSTPALSQKKNSFMLIVLSGFLIMVILAFIAIGSPKNIRAKEFDATRITDLKSISNDIRGFVKKENRLPRSLNELKTTYAFGNEQFFDPETSEEYRYVPQGESRGEALYKLCSRFGAEYQLEMKPGRRNYRSGTIFDLFDLSYNNNTNRGTYTDNEWYYEPGEWCFDRTEKLNNQIVPKITPFPRGGSSVPSGEYNGL